MAGHSQFKNIMHRKGRQDAQKSKLFSKLAREITVAAKLGTPDPAMNPRLRAAVIAARAENMPKDNIERAIKKASGNDAESYDELRYEGYGPGGVAVIMEVLTDNRNRAASDIRSYFTKSGGNLGETGSVAFMFDRTGIIEYDSSVASDDAMLDAAIEAGADDVISSESGHEVYASQESFREVAKALEAKFGEPRKAALTWKPCSSRNWRTRSQRSASSSTIKMRGAVTVRLTNEGVGSPQHANRALRGFEARCRRRAPARWSAPLRGRG